MSASPARAPRLETPTLFPGHREVGLARWEAFLPHAGRDYQAERNHDYGPDRRHNTAVLSPFISHRLLTEQELVTQAQGRHGESGAYKFVSEVYWRTYFKGWLESRPSVWTRYQGAVRDGLDGLKGGRRKAYDQATGGQTGIECFDAWTEELVSTGYLHNHARMWYASIWIFTLGLPWALGADFFYRNLLGGDAASNTLSWRWVAGLHTSGKAYAATASNIAKYTDGRFGPVGQLARAEALPDDGWNGSPAPLPKRQAPRRGVPTLLLLHEDDLHPESVEGLDVLDIVGVAAIQCTEDRSPLGAEELVMAFAAEALGDGVRRAAAAFGGPGSVLDGPGDLIAAAKEAGAEQVVTPYVPVGEVADRIAGLTPDLEAAGIPLVQVRRDYDEAAWPHCTKGFFALKKQIPSLIAAY